VDPESNRIFNGLLDLTVPMVSATIMITGIKFLVGEMLEALFISFFLLMGSGLGSRASAM
jgi:hypothetical protein